MSLGLLKDIISTACDYISSNGAMIWEWWIEKDVEGDSRYMF
jgi:hypothetical protein